MARAPASSVHQPNWIDAILLRDRKVTLIALATVIVGCWFYVLGGAGTGMSTWAMTSWDMALGLPGSMSAAMSTPVNWSVGYAAVMVAMWWVMMIAMMLPSAAPVILLYGKVDGGTRAREGQALSLLPTAFFVLGYGLSWGAFSVAAAGLQWSFETTGLLSPFMMNPTSEVFAGLVLLYAGVYQLSPLKTTCLKHCQGPLQFLTRHWKPGNLGALRMGLHHGAYCLGCCIGLMVILFFGGIMNLYWIAGLAALVFAEKVTPVGPWLPRVTGAFLIAWSLVFFARAAA